MNTILTRRQFFSRTVTGIGGTIALPLLFWASLGNGLLAGERTTPLPFLSVSQTPRAPVIDGRIGEGEWRCATKTTGFLGLVNGEFADPQTTVHVTYDAERLYVAFECALDPESLPKAAETNRDGSVFSDDCFELLLQLPGRGDEQVYHFIGNALGAIYDDYARDKNWNGRWQYKTASARRGWSGELAIPFADLGTKDPAGQTWRVNFCRSVGEYTTWADTIKGYCNPPRFGELRFSRDAVVAQVGPFAGFDAGGVNVKTRVLNPGARADRGSLGVRVTSGAAAAKLELPRLETEAWRPARRASLPAGASMDLAVTETLLQEGPKRLEIALADANGRELYRQAIPFVAKAIRHVALLADPSEEMLFVRAKLRAWSKGNTAEVHLRFEQTGKEWRQDRVYKNLAIGKPHTFREDIRAWPSGPYQVCVRIVAAAGEKVLHESDLRCERVATPEWLTAGRTLGLSRQVLKPWTPVKWNERTLAVCGREHDFGDALLPAQIASAGESLLVQPVALNAVCDGQPREARLERRQTISSDPDVVVTRAEGRLGPLRLQLTTTAEYDGMIKFELERNPFASSRSQSRARQNCASSL